ncbi:MAG: ATP-binding protein [Paludibacter sp.]|nr:ATP-binding protein [Paludibacter sp.]
MDNSSNNNIPNVLIVDDIEENLLYIESVIKNFNINLIRALSGNEALDKIRELDLVLAIIDVRMPGMSGYELAEKINETRVDIKVPIIFITANIFSEIEELKGYGAGAVDYIYKPFSSQILKSKVSIFLDLYNQKQTIIRNAVQLKENEEKYRTMINASPDGVVLVDLTGKMKDVSDIGIELFGASAREEILGKEIYQFIADNSKEQINKAIHSTLTQGFAKNIELKLKKINQSVFLSEISATLIQGNDGNPLSILIVIRDISQRKKLQANQIHADRMASLGQMAAGMAHEINQPLNIISMVIDKLLFEANKHKQVDLEILNEKANKIFENLTRIRNIIDHIRVFSRSNVEYIPIAFDVNLSIENAISMISEQFKHLGIKMNIQLGEQIPQLVGNTYQFEQVIINLLSNAKDAILEKKSADEKYTDFNIDIDTFANEDNLIIEVKDNGMGIREEDINNILLPFFSTKEEGKGTGLGLSICYQIIKDMGGNIDISSIRSKQTIIKLIFDLNKINYGATR